MPMKRRASKHRLPLDMELALWGCVFDGGSFLIPGSEDMLGLDPGDDIEAAARDAWARLGHLHDGDGA